MGRPPIRKKGAFTAAERQARHRKKLRREAKEAARALRQPEQTQLKTKKGFPPSTQEMKKRAYRAFREAVDADPRSANLFESWMERVRASAAGRPDSIAWPMWHRLAMVYEIIEDMRRWPDGLVWGVTE
jgi:hypothetical protein